MANRVNNAKRNIYSGVLNKILNIFFPFLVRTVLIQQLGMNYLGLDNLFVSILQILNLSELGFSSAVVYCMYEPVAQNNLREINSLYKFIRKAYQTIGLIILFLGLLITPFICYLISGEVSDNINIYVLYLIYLFNTVISYLMYAYKNTLLNAYQRLDIYNNVLTISKTAMCVIQVVVLLAFKNYYLYLIVMPISTMLNNLIISYVVNKRFPEVKPEGAISEEASVTLRNQVIGLFISKIGLVSRNSFDSIVISMYLGLTINAIYSNYYYVMNSISALLIILCGSIIPSVGNSMAAENTEKNYNDFCKFNYFYLWVTCWASTCLLTMYQPFMELWVGKNSTFSIEIVILFVTYFFSIQMGNIKSSYSEAAGLWWQNRYRSIWESVLNISLNLILGKIWGVYGILIATILTIIFINFVFTTRILYRYYFYNYNINKFYYSSIKYAALTLISCVLSFFVSNLFALNLVLRLFFSFIVSTSISNIIFYLGTRKSKVCQKSIIWAKQFLNMN